jgi:hypothetical protein
MPNRRGTVIMYTVMAEAAAVAAKAADGQLIANE